MSEFRPVILQTDSNGYSYLEPLSGILFSSTSPSARRQATATSLPPYLPMQVRHRDHSTLLTSAYATNKVLPELFVDEPI